jgi:hypothetical protein
MDSLIVNVSARRVSAAERSITMNYIMTVKSAGSFALRMAARESLRSTGAAPGDFGLRAQLLGIASLPVTKTG